MSDKIKLEFFPEIVQLIPESPDACCTLKAIITQSKLSKQMYALAQHINWKYHKKIELVVPSKSESRVSLVKKYTQYQADRRMKKVGLKKIPALVLNGEILIEGELLSETELDEIVEKKIKNLE
jgi:serine kinase of HPr protein (carbohydrate metabolism regulator)